MVEAERQTAQVRQSSAAIEQTLTRRDGLLTERQAPSTGWKRSCTRAGSLSKRERTAAAAAARYSGSWRSSSTSSSGWPAS